MNNLMPTNFQPNEDNCDRAKSLGLNVQIEYAKFLCWHDNNEYSYPFMTWQQVFGRWLNTSFMKKMENGPNGLNGLNGKGGDMKRKHPMDGIGFSNGNSCPDPREYDREGKVIVSDAVRKEFEKIDSILGRKSKVKDSKTISE